MRDSDKTRDQLLEEVVALRQRVAALEAAEQSRRDRDDWARQLLDASPLGIHECDTEGRISFVNPAQEAISGYSADELLGTYVWDRIEAGPERETTAQLLKSLVGGDAVPSPFFAKNVRKNGEVFDIRIDWNYRRNPQGQVIGFVSILSDVTAQKRQERELRQSQAILRAMIDCLPFDFFALGSDGRYILQNSASKQLWGDCAGKTPEEICTDASRLAGWVENNRRAYAGERFERESTFIVNGEEQFYLAVLAPIRDDIETYGILGVNIDITQRRRAEEALRQSEQRYRTLTESTTDMIFILNRTGDVLYANRSAAAGIRHEADSLVGRRQDELFSQEKVQTHRDSIAAVLETGEVFDEDGMYHFGPDEIWLNTRLMPLRDEAGRITAVMGVARDITDRKRAEAVLKEAHDELEKRVEERTAELAKANESLRQSEQKHKSLVEASPDAVIIADVKGNVLFASHHSWEFLGFSDQEDLVGRSVFDFVIESDRPRLAANVPELMKTRIRRNTEYTVLRKDGTTFPVEISSAAGPNTQEQPWAILAVVRDISERKRYEETLRESEEKYRGLVDICPDAIVVSDLTGRTQFVSKQTWKLLGVPEDEELLGQNTFDYVIQADRPRLAANYAELLKTGTRGQTEYTVLRPDGSTVPIELSSVMSRDAQGRPIGAMAIIRDISERKQAQEALRQSEEKHRRILEICPDVVVVTDLAGKALFISKQAWTLLGLPEQVELVGQSVFDYVVEADRPRLAANIANLIATGRPRNEEYTALRPDGMTIPTELSSAVIRDAQGQPTALMAMIRDVSERKRAEQALQQHYEELRAIYDGMSEGLVILDIATDECIRANRAMCEMLRYSEEELRTLPVEKLHPREVLAERAKRHQGMIDGRISHGEDIPLVRKDGSLLYIDIVSDRITYNGRACLIHLVRDTTERRQAQEALKKEHRTLKHLLRSSDHERQLIAYEIHDGLAQQLAGAIMQIETYWHQKEARPVQAAKAYEAAVTMLRQAHFEARRLISGVRPPILDESGIVAAVAHLVNEQRLHDEQKIEFLGEVAFHRLVPILENAVYRIVQEALTNACRHSKSDRVRVELVQCEDVLRIKVQDWGAGFNPAAVREDHFGLEGIRERARLLGGATTIESAPQRGTSITVELPLMLREE
jgi:PAS domain S-box-containing protein